MLLEAEVDRWHALCSMRSVSVWNDFSRQCGERGTGMQGHRTHDE